MKQKFGSVLLALCFGIIIQACNNSTTTSESTSSDSSNKMSEQHDTASTSAATPASGQGLMSSMNKMMDKMHGMNMTGDFDIDFANMMIEHHQGAIDMSEQELSGGKDEKMKAMAQKIINAQKKEISQLQDIVKNYKPSGMKHGEGDLQKSMEKMQSDMQSMKMSGDMDKDFATTMISHHQSAVDMAKLQVKNAMNDELKKMAKKTIADQTKEIAEFKSWLSTKQ